MDTTQIDPEEMKNLAISLGAPYSGGNMLMPPTAQSSATPQPAQHTNELGAPLPDSSGMAIDIPKPSHLDALKGERQRLQSTGAGVDQIYGKVTGSDFGHNHPVLGKILGGLGQGVAKLGDIGLSAIAPSLAINLPGTEYHHNQLMKNVTGQIGNEEKEGQEEAQTANLNAQPELKQAQLELGHEKENENENHHQAQIDEQLAQHGFKTGPDGKITPLPYQEMSQEQQAVHDLKASQEEEADAAAALKKVQADPNSPQARMAQQRIDNARQTRAIAMQRLGLSEAQFSARYHGTDTSGEALPGAMMTDDNRPVGSAFSANVRPTGTERNKADLANSAASQIGDMKTIIAKRPDIFGPAAGRKTDMTVWLGSQDPDAQRFRAARTIAGDHLAGTFGGRSEAALHALDNALGQFKDNPEAAMAGLDQLAGANKSFQKAGTVRSAGSQAQAPSAPSGKEVSLKDARALPQNKGKSDADIRKDIEAHGHKVAE